MRNALFGDQRVQPRKILELLGFVAPAERPHPTVLFLYKFLKGRPIEPKTTLEDGSVTIEDLATPIPPGVKRLYDDLAVRRKVDGVLAPLLKEGVDEFKVKDGERTTEVVTKEEFVAVKEEPVLEKMAPGELLASGEMPMAVEIVKVPFRTNLVWNLAVGDQRINAEMADANFLARHQAAETSFSTGDILRVVMRSSTYRTDKGLKTRNEIIRVIGQIHRSDDGQETIF